MHIDVIFSKSVLFHMICTCIRFKSILWGVNEKGQKEKEKGVKKSQETNGFVDDLLGLQFRHSELVIMLGCPDFLSVQLPIQQDLRGLLRCDTLALCPVQDGLKELLP